MASMRVRVGDRYKALTVLEIKDDTFLDGNIKVLGIFWRALCDCGKEVYDFRGNLEWGDCGCKAANNLKRGVGRPNGSDPTAYGTGPGAQISLAPRMQAPRLKQPSATMRRPVNFTLAMGVLDEVAFWATREGKNASRWVESVLVEKIEYLREVNADELEERSDDK